MPCTNWEDRPGQIAKEASRVIQLLRELQFGSAPDSEYGTGFYLGSRCSENKVLLDHETEFVCTALTMMDPEKIKIYSLELQTWWRDHQKHDAERRAQEALALKKQALRESGLVQTHT